MKHNEWMPRLPITIRAYTEDDLEMRITDSKERGYEVTSQGFTKKQEFTQYWARLKPKETIKQ